VTLGVAIIGCGLIGAKRAAALGKHNLRVCADTDLSRAQILAQRTPGAKAMVDWQKAIAEPDVKVVIVATTNDALASIAEAAVKAGRHVLIEKPAARNVREISTLVKAAHAADVKVRVGFNHRYHPAIRKSLSMARDGVIGELMFLRGRYGHGGRIGYDREWRADATKAGGGELIDQGVHMIDLARCFLGEFEHVSGHAATYFWDMPVDDNAFLLLRTNQQRAAFLHVSCTEWKNLFSLEIYGRDGKLQIDGLGGSYGIERLTHYRMLPEMGPPETTIWEYPRGDDSWASEYAEFADDILLDRQPSAGITDALKALQIVEEIYKISGYDHC
jgi:predicted dehydrogenase